MNALERKMNREIVRFAVQRAIFCPGCQNVLDVDDAVVVTGGGAAVSCGSCFDSSIKVVAEYHGKTVEEILALLGPENVDDGRLLR